MSRNEEIDFVITWVDGSDPAWKKEKAQYVSGDEPDDREERYRDWNNLQYFFRGVEKFAPWVRKIHFITWGHVPSWLNTTHPKLQIVNHKDYIPAAYLPTFNSNAIEMHMHRIAGLAEQFVYFNDDMLLLAPVKPENFFHDGKPCDMLAFQPVVANPANPVMSHIYLNNSLALCRHFSKRENVKKQPGSYFKIGYPPMYFFYNLLELLFPLYTGFYTVHGPAPFLKETFEKVWAQEEEALRITSQNRFRDDTDVSQYLFREWQKLSGGFWPVNLMRQFGYFNVDNTNRKLLKTIRGQKKSIICINDANCPIEFARVSQEIREALAEILPDKSSFEK